MLTNLESNYPTQIPKPKVDHSEPIDPLAQEQNRINKLENLKEYVAFKKTDVEYESETIELYEMISDEFDYDLLRTQSPYFNIK